MTRYPHISENENIERVCDARYINGRNFSKRSEFIRNETETIKLRLFFLKKKKKKSFVSNTRDFEQNCHC